MVPLMHFTGSICGGSLKLSLYSYLDLNLPLFSTYLKKETSSALWGVCLSQCVIFVYLCLCLLLSAQCLTVGLTYIGLYPP